LNIISWSAYVSIPISILDILSCIAIAC
jgi:hypothetical protein